MSARRCTTGRAGPSAEDGSSAWRRTSVSAPGGSAPMGSPRPGRTGTAVEATADTVRGAVAGRRATISGGAVRRARTGAGGICGDADRSPPPDAVPATAGTTRLGTPVLRPARATGAEGAKGAMGAAGARSAGAASPSPGAEGATGATARNTSGAPEGAVRGLPGVAVTPCTRPTGADGSTAWPRSPSL
ncbi:hypothetical protein FKN01_14925 [Streptomyces sp. 130]|uniref:hypothetical protein n=1 Tax=Streptomyces sp. 130 TaxID=2591006 RepID=UPI00117E198C|nr:hypothetical protein [Streptomyces sp. 130]TRV77775.1 hypothetical protein FKN01_14925 [Streptomyces sp. 130]